MTVELHCSFCGAVQWFSREQVDAIRIVPPCPRCGEQTWLHLDGRPAQWPGSLA